MNLVNLKKSLHEKMKGIADSLNVKLNFEGMTYNSKATSSILLSCSFLLVEPTLIALRAKRSQVIMQVDYICEDTPSAAEDDAKIKGIADYFTIDTHIDGEAIIYKPTAVTQWQHRDSKRVAFISVYFQIDEVI